MQNMIKTGLVVTVIAPVGGCVSGKLYRINSLVGVACFDAAAGAEVELQTLGEFDLDKTSAQAWTVGQPVYAVAATNVLTNVPGTGNYLVGVATAIAANPSSIGRARLNGSFGHPVTV